MSMWDTPVPKRRRRHKEVKLTDKELKAIKKEIDEKRGERKEPLGNTERAPNPRVLY